MRFLAAILVVMASALAVAGENRFPKPQFEGNYTLPSTAEPGPRISELESLDVIVLFLALSLAAWLALKKRSRRGIFLLMVFSLVYFGFWRKGCVCSIGSIQNMTAWLFDGQYMLPLSAAVFFILPLAFALLFGRVFCAAVCPLGAIQDAVVLYPLKLPPFLRRTLALIPYVYLGLAALFAATGTGFIICRMDPFVGFFRLSGSLTMLIAGLIFLAAGIFIARPYCRFVCPYGVLLGWMSRLSWKHSTITPDECVRCRLCENACPFDAIEKPNADEVREPRPAGIRRLVGLLVILPLLIAGGGYAGSRLDIFLSAHHRTVQLEESLEVASAGGVVSQDVEAFRGTGQTPAQVKEQADALTNRFRAGGWILGALLGAVFGVRLIGLSVRRTREDYEPNRGTCLSCARCFLSCPREHARLKGKEGGSCGR